MCQHNPRNHDFLLRQCPDGAQLALDVGCGLGEFARRLADRVQVVHAIDVDPAAINRLVAEDNSARSHYRLGDFLQADLADGTYDFVSAIASVHHMELDSALIKMKGILKPGGMVAILGLYREATAMDFLYTLVSFPLKLALRIAHIRRALRHHNLESPRRNFRFAKSGGVRMQSCRETNFAGTYSGDIPWSGKNRLTPRVDIPARLLLRSGFTSGLDSLLVASLQSEAHNAQAAHASELNRTK